MNPDENKQEEGTAPEMPVTDEPAADDAGVTPEGGEAAAPAAE